MAVSQAFADLPRLCLEATVQETDGTIVSVINDSFGNVFGSIASGSVVSNPIRVGAYGPVTGYRPAGLGLGTALADTLVWRSRWMDPGGLYHLGARDYDPVAGHFLSPDPLGHAGSMDLYSFCDGDPINRFDPTGQFRKWVSEKPPDVDVVAQAYYEAGLQIVGALAPEFLGETVSPAVGGAIGKVFGAMFGADCVALADEGALGVSEALAEEAATTVTGSGITGQAVDTVGIGESAETIEQTTEQATLTADADAAGAAGNEAAPAETGLQSAEASPVGELEDSSGMDFEARNAAANAEWETQNYEPVEAPASVAPQSAWEIGVVLKNLTFYDWK